MDLSVTIIHSLGQIIIFLLHYIDMKKNTNLQIIMINSQNSWNLPDINWVLELSRSLSNCLIWSWAALRLNAKLDSKKNKLWFRNGSQISCNFSLFFIACQKRPLFIMCQMSYIIYQYLFAFYHVTEWIVLI